MEQKYYHLIYASLAAVICFGSLDSLLLLFVWVVWTVCCNYLFGQFGQYAAIICFGGLDNLSKKHTLTNTSNTDQTAMRYLCK